MTPHPALPEVAQINVNAAGGVPKHPVETVEIRRGGVVGDRQNDVVHHGGPERAVSLFCVERIDALRSEGHPIGPGTTGENLTLRGLDWDRLRPGDRLKIGSQVLLELSGYANPCKTIQGSFIEGKFDRLSQKVHPGWSRFYARVIQEGAVSRGDVVEHIPQT